MDQKTRVVNRVGVYRLFKVILHEIKNILQHLHRLHGLRHVVALALAVYQMKGDIPGFLLRQFNPVLLANNRYRLAGDAELLRIKTPDFRQQAILNGDPFAAALDGKGQVVGESLLLMGPQWRERADRQQSLLGHSGCRIGGNDLDIALAFKCLMPLLGMGGETEKGTALPILPWWNAVAINDVPAQSDFYSTANGRLLNDLLRSARDADKVALLLKVWRQRLSYRLVRSAEESKIALSSAASVETALPFIQDELATAIAQQGLEAALDQPLTRIMEQVQLALDSSQTTPDVIYLTGGSARSPLIKKALTAQLPGIPLAGGDDFGSVTAGLARWAQVVFR